MTSNKPERSPLGVIIAAILFAHLLLGMAFLVIFGTEAAQPLPDTSAPEHAEEGENDINPNTELETDSPVTQFPELHSSDYPATDFLTDFYLYNFDTINGNSHVSSPYRDIYMKNDRQNGQTVLYIQTWKCFRTVPFVRVGSLGANAIARFGNNCWYVIADQSNTEPTNTLTMAKLTRQSEQAEVCTLQLPHKIAVKQLFLYFYDSEHGSLVVSGGSTEQQTVLLKTENGGKTWSLVEAPLPCPTNTAEPISFAKFISKNIGIVSYHYDNGVDFCDRTLLTRDGGQTWEPFSDLPYQQGTGHSLYAFEYVNGEYVLTVMMTAYASPYEQYTSTNLENWIFTYSIDSGK